MSTASTLPTAAAITDFVHAQVAAWNAGDREAFFAAYRQAAPNGLRIEYVGRGPASDGWPVLEHMWAQQAARIQIEALALVVNGTEAACHHRNHLRGTTTVIETIELYHFQGDGQLGVRYFIATP
ncbi:MAG: hypothetical protein CFE45_06360 [Burkholderiales bacterium PBB5]|nr:MAG: hypothetical protein CFE45_06360 [Burkholderiales bacterium PBB5]